MHAQPMIPRPVSDIPSTGVWLPTAHPFTVAASDFAPYCLEAFFERQGAKASAQPDNADITAIRNACLPKEGYRLSIRPTGAIIEAGDESGVIHALTSLYLLLAHWKGKAMPCRDIEDMPRYSHRGLSLDCVRHFFDADEVMRLIESMSLCKLNVLHWHLTDDQGWRIEFKRHPEIAEQPGNPFYTQEQIRRVISHARARGIEVIPEIELPGHTRGLLVAHPELSCTGEAVDYATQGGIHDIILCPGREETFDLVEDILDEMAELFDSPRIHIGGDEAPKTRWAACPRCKARMEREGLDDLEQLQGYFTNRVTAMLEGIGRTPICWNESLEASNLKPGATIQFWTPSHQDPVRTHMEHGGRLIFSDMFDLYLDYPASMTPMRRIHGVRPVIDGVDYSSHPNLDGMEAAIWCEHIDDDSALERRLFPRLFAFAENAWSSPGDYDAFLVRLPDMFAQLDRLGIAHLDAVQADPEGEARQQETFAYMAQLSSNLAEGTAEASNPNEAFQHAFMTKFFHPEDLPLLAGMAGGR